MSRDKKTYRLLTEQEIQDYLQGKVRGREAHKLERHLLNDPFDRDAVEGFGTIGNEMFSHDVQILKKRISRKGSVGNALRIAASIALFLSCAGIIWITIDRAEQPDRGLTMKKSEEITENTGPEPMPEPPQPEIPEKGISLPAPQLSDQSVTKDPVVEDSYGSLKEKIPESLSEELAIEEEFDVVSDQELIFNPASGIAAKSEASTREGSEAANHHQAEPTKRIARSHSLQASDDNVFGLVTDVYGEPLSGVAVTVKKSPTGTVTDINGRYELSLADKEDTLQFSFVGFESAEAVANVGQQVNMELESDLLALNEVVVTNYSEEQLEMGYDGAHPTIGLNEFKADLAQELVYPEEARERGIEGKVVLKVTIAESGEISAVEVKRSLGFGCDEEAIRLVREGPAWEPAKRDGKPVESTVRVRVKFELE